VVLSREAQGHPNSVLRDALRRVCGDTENAHSELLGSVKINVVEASAAEKDKLHTVARRLHRNMGKGKITFTFIKSRFFFFETEFDQNLLLAKPSSA
jgi:hypothetical protein